MSQGALSSCRREAARASKAQHVHRRFAAGTVTCAAKLDTELETTVILVSVIPQDNEELKSENERLSADKKRLEADLAEAKERHERETKDANAKVKKLEGELVSFDLVFESRMEEMSVLRTKTLAR